MDQSSGYGQGRTMPGLRGGAILEQHDAGGLFSQPWVEDKTGEQYRLDSLLGDGFALVSKNKLPVLNEASKRVLKHLDMKQVSLQGYNLTQGNWDKCFDEHELVIVRPDRYVFGCGRLEDADLLIEDLADRLCLTTKGN